MNIAKVVVDLSLDREFDYRIPPALAGRVRVGSRVRVPFGRGDTVRTGYVVGLAEKSDYPKIKDILGVEGEKELISADLLKLARWMAEYYCCTREQAVRALLPAAVRSGRVTRRKVRYVGIEPDVDLGEILPRLEKRRAAKQAAVLRLLVRVPGEIRWERLRRETGAGPEVLRRLEQKKWVRVSERIEDRDPFAGDVILPTRPLEPSPEQRRAIQAVCAAMDAAEPRVFLLHGITGSGKTEVYLQAIAAGLERGRGAIVLVPEISLTPQTAERFRARFGDRVSVLHSGLSDGERFDEWTRIHSGRSRVVVGARSALFAPVQNLALIVVDEEHETTYKQDEAPRYNARDTAVMRGRMENAVVLLGSATPSLESWWNCRNGKYTLLQLPRRVDDRRLPAMELVDMRAEAALQGGARVFSRRLVDLVRGTLARREQAILFLNRRGYATQMICTKCGYVAECPDCSIAYTYHRRAQQLVCHFCGRVMTAPFICPQCRDPEIRYTGLGTEKVEAIARSLFPKANIVRMDSDTMTRRNAYKKTLFAFRAGRIDMLIGTQMIAKGLDFPKVTLVGVIYADLGLHLQDFRAGERTFQLLTQVAGRAGRGDLAGRVLVQTYTPFHPALQAALSADLEGYYEDEITARRALRFPPAAHMVLVHFHGPDNHKVRDAAAEFAGRLREKIGRGAEIAGPIPAPMAKLRGRWRWQIMLRCARILPVTRELRSLLIESARPREWSRQDITVYADVDPIALL